MSCCEMLDENAVPVKNMQRNAVPYHLYRKNATKCGSDVLIVWRYAAT